jgi:excisionase family DNA binding protein
MTDMRIKPPPGNSDPPDIDVLRAAIEPLVDGLRDEIHALREEVRALRGQRDADALLDMDEAAEILGVSRRTVDTLVHAGEITSLKVRRCRRIPRKALDAYIRRQAEGENANA